MGTHLYFFCSGVEVPTIRELFEWSQNRGHTLHLHLDDFDDDEEEGQFLLEHLDSRTWPYLPVAEQQGRWVGNLSYQRKGTSYFAADLQMFQNRVLKVTDSAGKAQVSAALAAADLLFDFQVNVSAHETWPAQDVLTDYFFEHLNAIAYLDNVDAFVQGKQTLLRT